MSTESIEDRVAALETEVARLKEKFEGNQTPGWKKFVGAFGDDPLFEKAMKYGRQYRESQRPGKKNRT